MSVSSRPNEILIGDFSSKSFHGWKSKEFSRLTSYQFVNDESRWVLRADANKSASALYREIRIDLHDTPYLNWSWRVEKTFGLIDERNKSGDDFAARIYVVVGGWAFWRTRALNYVWASQAEVGSIWPNPFAGDHSMTIALRSKGDKKGSWYVEKRNIREDLDKIFGLKIRYINAVALMSDADNTGLAARAFYGDIFFSAE